MKAIYHSPSSYGTDAIVSHANSQQAQQARSSAHKSYIINCSFQLQTQEHQRPIDVCYKILITSICSTQVQYSGCMGAPRSGIFGLSRTVVTIGELHVHVFSIIFQHEPFLNHALQEGKFAKFLLKSCYSDCGLSWRGRLRLVVYLGDRRCVSSRASAHTEQLLTSGLSS